MDKVDLFLTRKITNDIMKMGRVKNVSLVSTSITEVIKSITADLRLVSERAHNNTNAKSAVRAST